MGSELIMLSRGFKGLWMENNSDDLLFYRDLAACIESPSGSTVKPEALTGKNIHLLCKYLFNIQDLLGKYSMEK